MLPGYSPSTSRSFRASSPGDRMKNTGVAGLLSSHALPRSNLPLSTYCAPSFSSTKFLFKKRTCKSRTKQQQPFQRKQTKNWMTEFELEKCQCLDELGTRKKLTMFTVRGVFRRDTEIQIDSCRPCIAYCLRLETVKIRSLHCILGSPSEYHHLSTYGFVAPKPPTRPPPPLLINS